MERNLGKVGLWLHKVWTHFIFVLCNKQPLLWPPSPDLAMNTLWLKPDCNKCSALQCCRDWNFPMSLKFSFAFVYFQSLFIFRGVGILFVRHTSNLQKSFKNWNRLLTNLKHINFDFLLIGLPYKTSMILFHYIMITSQVKILGFVSKLIWLSQFFRLLSFSFQKIFFRIFNFHLCNFY